jgi:hypothetical protein
MIILETVQLIGRGSTVQIDEKVIVEEYPFFARRLMTGYNTYK